MTTVVTTTNQREPVNQGTGRFRRKPTDKPKTRTITPMSDLERSYLYQHGIHGNTYTRLTHTS